MSNRYFAFSCFTHANFVDCEGHDGSAVLGCHRYNALNALTTILHIDRIDNCSSRIGLQRRFNHIRLGRIDHQWSLNTHRKLLNGLCHLPGFVCTLGKRDAHIQHMRAPFNLLASNTEQRVVIIVE